jgi:hypothetical protein
MSSFYPGYIDLPRGKVLVKLKKDMPAHFQKSGSDALSPVGIRRNTIAAALQAPNGDVWLEEPHGIGDLMRGVNRAVVAFGGGMKKWLKTFTDPVSKEDAEKMGFAF